MQNSSQKTGLDIDACEHASVKCLICEDADRDLKAFVDPGSSKRSHPHPVSEVEPTRPALIFDDIEGPIVQPVQSDNPSPPTPATPVSAATAWPTPGPSYATAQNYESYQDCAEFYINNPNFVCPNEPLDNNPIQQQQYPVHSAVSYDPYSENPFDVDEFMRDIEQPVTDSAPCPSRRLRPSYKSGSTDSGTGSDLLLGRDDIDEIDADVDVNVDEAIYANGDDEYNLDEIVRTYLNDTPISPSPLTLFLRQPECLPSTPAFDCFGRSRISSDGSAISPKPTLGLIGPSTLMVPENETPEPSVKSPETGNVFAVVFFIISVVIIRFFFL